MKALSIGGFAIVAVGLALAPAVSTIYREAFPTEATRRAALAACARLDPDFQVLTGVVPDAGTVAAKLAWISRHDPERLKGQRWILGPRDLVAFRLTGRAVTVRSLPTT